MLMVQGTKPVTKTTVSLCLVSKLQTDVTHVLSLYSPGHTMENFNEDGQGDFCF